MTKIISFFIVLCFLSCKRNENINEHTTYKSKILQVCDFGQANYNTIKRLSKTEAEIEFRRGKNIPKAKRESDKDGILDIQDNCSLVFNPDQLDSDFDGIGDACDNIDNDTDRDGIYDLKDNCPTVYNPDQTDSNGNGIGNVCENSQLLYDCVLFFDFDGHIEKSNYWTYATSGVPVFFAPSALSETEIYNIMAQIRLDYSQFPITVTTDSLVYFAGNPKKRARIVVTDSASYNFSTVGVAYVGSITWIGGGDASGLEAMAGYVNTRALLYSQKMIGEACSHEAGHTFGLGHQARYDDTCRFVWPYNNGYPLPVAPIMGNSYNNPGIWWIGKSELGCDIIQNDSIEIRKITGY